MIQDELVKESLITRLGGGLHLFSDLSQREQALWMDGTEDEEPPTIIGINKEARHISSLTMDWPMRDKEYADPYWSLENMLQKLNGPCTDQLKTVRGACI